MKKTYTREEKIQYYTEQLVRASRRLAQLLDEQRDQKWNQGAREIAEKKKRRAA